jgi:hemolysin activation/secretion protein
MRVVCRRHPADAVTGAPRRRVALGRWLASGAAALAVALGSVTLVRGQTASQITPPTFRPDLPAVGGAVVFSGEPGLAAPAGAERLSVAVSGVTVEGGLPELAPAHRALEARLVGGRVPVSEIFAAAQDLEAAYAQAGYVLARVVLPQQSLRDGGRLRLVVVNGFIERVDAQGVPERVRPWVESLVEPLVGERSLTLGEIERRLLLAGDTPGVALSSALSAGSAQGGAVLTIDADYHSVTGFVGLDNTLADDLGTWTVSTGVDLNSLLGRGEVFYVRASGYPGGDDDTGYGGLFTGYPRSRTLAAGAVFPIGTNGLNFNIEATGSRTTPEPTGLLQTRSEFERFSLRLGYPFVRSRELNFSGQLIFDAQSESQHVIEPRPLTFSADVLRILRAAVDARRQFDSGAVLAGRAVLSFGLDAFGAKNETSADDTPFSRTGADAEFQKLEVIARYERSLAEHVGFTLYARGQTSFGQVMPTSEQIGIASFQELSTFDAGTLGGDSGWVVRGDLESPWTVQARALPVQITPYAFAGTGSLYLEQPTAVEQSQVNVGSLGVGVQVAAIRDPRFSDGSLTLEFGRAFRDDGIADDNRFTVVGAFRF